MDKAINVLIEDSSDSEGSVISVSSSGSSEASFRSSVSSTSSTKSSKRRLSSSSKIHTTPKKDKKSNLLEELRTVIDSTDNDEVKVQKVKKLLHLYTELHEH